MNLTFAGFVVWVLIKIFLGVLFTHCLQICTLRNNRCKQDTKIMAFYKFIFNRTGRLRADGTGVIHLRVTAGRKVKYVNTGIYVMPDEWDNKHEGGIVVKNRFAMKYNQILRETKDRIKAYEFRCRDAGVPFLVGNIDKALKEDNDSFIDFIREDITADPRLAFSTKNNHLSFINTVEGSGLFNGFSDINYENIELLDRYLRNVRKMNPQTIAKRHTMLHGYIRRAIKKQKIKADKNPYLFFEREKVIDTKRKFLSAGDLQKIREKDLHVERLEHIRDFFLFSCYTGLAYSDILRLTPAGIIRDHDTLFLVIDRQKTDEESAVPLLAPAIEILDRYMDDEKDRQERIFPIPTNQKMNAYLKEIQILCGIETNLTFHVARHTFATTVTLENGVPIETVSRMLGHSSLRTTQIYAKITRKKLADDMKKISGKI